MDFSFIDDWEEEGSGVAEPVGEGYRNVWAVAEAEAGRLTPASAAVVGQARELADQIGVYVYGVLLGDGVEAVGDELISYGADRVLVADDPALAEYRPETYTHALAALVDEYHPEIVLLPASELGNDVAPRLAQRLDTGLMSHCTELSMDMAERLLLGTSPVMGGEIFYTYACPERKPQIATLEPGYFRQPYADSYRSGDVQRVDVDLSGAEGRLEWLDLDVDFSLPQPPLRKSRVVVSAGRGMGDGDGFALVEQLAQALGGVVAGSRGALDEGWIDEKQVVGVGGETVKPDLYVACGLSGDVYHYFGLQEAGYVVAINPDEKAPIMKVANLAIVGDARQVIPAMLEALAE
ncbi:MAG: electron transfer flavoprotein subunit alpha/FixB family protein [Anaerolineae bacterium]|nr:electron transfer flavoprotein subunit alpha/FixB family protein [Anaerolineae bacterium]